jgi:hypothetical protein
MPLVRDREAMKFFIMTQFLRLCLMGVGIVWTSLLKELLEVVSGRLRLTLAAACGSHDVHHAGAACLPAVATVAVGCGCSLLKTLLAPLPTALGTLLDVLDGDIGRCLPTNAPARAKLGRLVAGGVLSGCNTSCDGNHNQVN